MAKDRDAGSRHLDQHGFDGLGPEPVSDTIGWIDLAVYGDTWYGANAALLVWLPGTPTGNLSLFGGSLNSWTVLDADVRTLAVGATALYDFRNGGAMKQYNGSPDNWLIIDETTKAEAIVAGGGLYQVRRDSSADQSIWQYTGIPCSGSSCPGWVKIDNHPYAAPVAGSNTVYELRSPLPAAVSIWQYTGTPCSGSICSAWVLLDKNPNTKTIVAGPVSFGVPRGLSGPTEITGDK